MSPWPEEFQGTGQVRSARLFCERLAVCHDFAGVLAIDMALAPDRCIRGWLSGLASSLWNDQTTANLVRALFAGLGNYIFHQ